MTNSASLRVRPEFAAKGLPLILQISERAESLRASGRPIINLTLGEPAVDTPLFIIQAAERAMRRGETRYTPVQGAARLREAIVFKLNRDLRLAYDDDEVMACAGGLQAISNALRATLLPGDEVIALAPFWGPYASIVSACGGRLRTSPTNSDGQPLIEALSRELSPATRWLLLNSPNNPSGAILSRASLASLAALLRAHPQVRVLCDDVYADLIYDQQERHCILQVDPDLAGRTLIVGSVSKAFAMTGWRLGYAAGPKSLITAMTAVQAATTHNPCSIAQAAAVVALEEGDNYLSAERARYRSLRDRFATNLERIPYFRVTPPRAGFYVFPSVVEALGRTTPSGRVILSDVDIADYLLEWADVATIPGSAFFDVTHAEPSLRLFFGTAESQIDEAAIRMAQALALLNVP